MGTGGEPKSGLSLRNAGRRNASSQEEEGEEEEGNRNLLRKVANSSAGVSSCGLKAQFNGGKRSRAN